MERLFEAILFFPFFFFSSFRPPNLSDGLMAVTVRMQGVCYLYFKSILKKYIFYFKYFLYIFMLFLYTNIKNNFLKKNDSNIFSSNFFSEK